MTNFDIISVRSMSYEFVCRMSNDIRF